MNELTMDERQNDIWADADDGKMYVIVMMYSAKDNAPPRFITSQKMKYETTVKKLEDMLNAQEQGRMVCLNSHFVNPENIICIKMDTWKDKNVNRFVSGEFYE